MMYNMSMLRHRFSKRTVGGGGGALNHLPLLFCKSVLINHTLVMLHLPVNYEFMSPEEKPQEGAVSEGVNSPPCALGSVR